LPYGAIHDALVDLIRAQSNAMVHVLFDGFLHAVGIVPEARAKLGGVPEARFGDAESQRLRLFSEIAQLFERLATDRGVVLLLDDLQWADAGTIQLLHYLLRQPYLNRLLVVGTYRGEELARELVLTQLLGTGSEEARVPHLLLEPLAERDLSSLVAERLHGPGDPILVRTLYQRSGGNPFFAIQMLRLLQEEGQLVQERSGWRTIAETRVDLPPAVRHIIARRLRHLQRDQREALTLGAVLGREFSYAALRAVWDGSERSLFEALDGAVEVHLLGETEDGYAFQHPLLSEVVYQRVPPARRAPLHERAALALEQLYGSRAKEHAVELAGHCVAAGRSQADRAVRYLLLAGDHAQRVYAHAEAERQYRMALELTGELRDIVRESEVLEKLADLLQRQLRHDEARKTYETALALVPEYDRIGQARLHWKIGETWAPFGASGGYEQRLQAYDLAEGALGDEPNGGEQEWRRTWMNIQLARIDAHYALGRPQEMADLLEKVRPVVEEAGTARQRARVFRNLALQGLRRDRYVASEDTLTYAHKSLAAQQEQGDPRETAEDQFMVGFCHLWHGDLDRAEELFQAALVATEQTQDALCRTQCLIYLTLVWRKRGEVASVREYIARSQTAATAAQQPGYAAMADAHLAWVAWRDGDLSGAQAKADTALDQWKGFPIPPFFYWIAIWPLLGVALAQDRMAEAIDHARTLLGPTMQPMPEDVAAPLAEAVAAWDHGEAERASAHLHLAAQSARQKGYL
jgi:tetratricopeptide (TPR) repeat protein